MEEKRMVRITINKNRGWRGLAKVEVEDDARKTIVSQIFSFSQKVWDDMIFRDLIVVQDETYYYVIRFSDPESKLPRPDQQRSVLIKNFAATIEEVNKYTKAEWAKANGIDYQAILNFRRNTNNHTTSDWNCIGIRVIPEI